MRNLSNVHSWAGGFHPLGVSDSLAARSSALLVCSESASGPPSKADPRILVADSPVARGDHRPSFHPPLIPGRGTPPLLRLCLPLLQSSDGRPDPLSRLVLLCQHPSRPCSPLPCLAWNNFFHSFPTPLFLDSVPQISRPQTTKNDHNEKTPFQRNGLIIVFCDFFCGLIDDQGQNSQIPRHLSTFRLIQAIPAPFFPNSTNFLVTYAPPALVS